SPQGPGASGTTGEIPVGGTLRLALQSDVQEAFDPQKEYYSVAWAFYRCCLLRTLLSYNGKTTADGGADVLPDLAADVPEQSADGLTWTFTLKQGFHYSAIAGFDEYAAGDADSISGLEAPDDHTLVVTTTEPTGDLPFRMAMPAAAPIPPNPNDPRARLGIAEGHDDNFGRFQVGTGPYMFE